MLETQERVWLSEWIIVEYNRELTKGRIGGRPSFIDDHVQKTKNRGVSLRKIADKLRLHHKNK
jgi:hypothetical protein